jgi:TolA-binding protein
VSVDLFQKPVAPLPPPRILSCNPIGTLFGVASELLECGRARFLRGEYEEARTALDGAVRGGTERGLLREARYWLGETLVRLGLLDAAERNFLLVVQDSSQGADFADYARSSLGWIALRLNDPARALVGFDDLLRGSPVSELIPFGRHGRALALYRLGRYAEAGEAWRSLLGVSLPKPLQLEVTFWLGETLGRVGEPGKSQELLERFTASALNHPLLETAILRLGWWALAAGHPLESAKAYRWFSSAFPRSFELPWARVGMLQTSLALNDWAAAAAEARRLRASNPSDPLVLPSFLLLSRWAVERKAADHAHAVHQELLAFDLQPPVRAYVLFLDGEAFRAEGRNSEARSQYEVVRSAQSASLLGRRARLRLAQMEFEAREFSRAAAESGALLGEALPEPLKATAFLLTGEAAYWGREYDTAADVLSRFLSEFTGHPQAGATALSLGWTELRRGRFEAARERLTAFARYFPTDPRAGEAMVLASELAGRAGDLTTARDLLDQMLARYPGDPRIDVALVNRGILALRFGRFEEASKTLGDLAVRVPLSPFLARARLARGVALLAAGHSGEAAQEFTAALQQGEGPLAELGLGSAALARRQLDEASRSFFAARDAGSEPVSQAAEYGLAAVAFHQGRPEEFRREAREFLQRSPTAPAVPRILYILAALAIKDGAWTEARQLTLRLVRDFRKEDAADDALFRLGSGARAAGQWPLARESFQLLRDRYPGSPFDHDARLGLAEALLKSGSPADAQAQLEPLVPTITGDPRLPTALLLLAQAREATGDRRPALEIYDRLVREFPNADETRPALIGQGRLLQMEGRWEESRQSLERVITGTDQAAAAEAAYWLAEGLRARGNHDEAVEAYMTAAYLAPASSWGRRALVGAGQSFSALKQADSAAIVYRKLLAQSGVEPELAGEARKALQRLGQHP